MNPETSSPGQKLRAAREALGRSASDLARATRITVQQIEALESDRYNRIPAPMYVRGFVKIYAQELGINPAPLLEAVERIIRGESEPSPESEIPQPLRGDFAPPPAVTSPAASPSLNSRIVKVTETWRTFSLNQRLAFAGAALLLLILLLFGRSCARSPSTDADPLPALNQPLLDPPEIPRIELPRVVP